MSGEYFDKFPEIKYNNVLVKDITRRVKFLKESLEDPFTFLPYTVKEGERANDIIDPYNEWPMDEHTFNQYLMAKYAGTVGDLKGYELVDFIRNTTITDNVLYYYKEV